MQSVNAKQRQQIINWYDMGFNVDEIHTQVPTVPLEAIRAIIKTETGEDA